MGLLFDGADEGLCRLAAADYDGATFHRAVACPAADHPRHDEPQDEQEREPREEPRRKPEARKIRRNLEEEAGHGRQSQCAAPYEDNGTEIVHRLAQARDLVVVGDLEEDDGDSRCAEDQQRILPQKRMVDVDIDRINRKPGKGEQDELDEAQDTADHHRRHAVASILGRDLARRRVQLARGRRRLALLEGAYRLAAEAHCGVVLGHLVCSRIGVSLTESR